MSNSRRLGVFGSLPLLALAVVPAPAVARDGARQGGDQNLVGVIDQVMGLIEQVRGQGLPERGLDNELQQLVNDLTRQHRHHRHHHHHQRHHHHYHHHRGDAFLKGMNETGNAGQGRPRRPARAPGREGPGPRP